MSKKINIAVVGLGFGAEFIPIWQRHPDTVCYAICQRDPKKLKSMLTEATMLHAKLLREWDSLAAQYRRAVPEISSIDAWKKTFEANSEGGR